MITNGSLVMIIFICNCFTARPLDLYEAMACEAYKERFEKTNVIKYFKYFYSCMRLKSIVINYLLCSMITSIWM